MKQLGIIVLILLIVGGGTFLFIKTQNNSGLSPYQNQNTSPSSAMNPSENTTTSGTAQASEIPLTVSTPSNNLTVSTSSIAVSGKTTASADVSVNDQDIKADTAGNFSTTLTLDEGENTIDIVASDKNGNFAEKELTVNFNSGQ